MFTASMLALLMVGARADLTVRCSVRELRESPGYTWRTDRVEANVDSATRIVRVRAIRANSAAHTVSFEPLEWIRGAPTSPEPLVLPGVVVDRDDYNRGSIPYQTVRPSGQYGSCFAEDYRLGQPYLLLLRDGAGPYPVHWWPLGPVNEQLRGEDDAWLQWVRARVAARRSSRSDT